MRFLFDTDTNIYWLKGKESIEHKVIAVGLAQISFSVVSKAELYYGAYKSEYIEQNLDGIHRLSEKVVFLPFDSEAARKFGKVKADLSRHGELITDADIMIAATALVNDLTLVTNNVNHFQRIDALPLENWV